MLIAVGEVSRDGFIFPIEIKLKSHSPFFWCHVSILLLIRHLKKNNNACEEEEKSININRLKMKPAINCALNDNWRLIWSHHQIVNYQT